MLVVAVLFVEMLPGLDGQVQRVERVALLVLALAAFGSAVFASVVAAAVVAV